MIISAADLKQYIETEESDPVLEVKLQALESLIRKYTNNNKVDICYIDSECEISVDKKV